MYFANQQPHYTANKFKTSLHFGDVSLDEENGRAQCNHCGKGFWGYMYAYRVVCHVANYHKGARN